MVERISTGFEPLDRILGGGVDSETITQVYGEAGSGKSNLAMMLARSAIVSGKKAIYIDTEGISLERLEQIFGDDFESMLSDMMLWHVYALEDQEKAVEKAVKLSATGKIGIIIIDSITGLYRLDLGTEKEHGSMRSLTKQMIELLNAARRHEIAVLITNQVYTDRNREEYRPIGGHVVDHYSKTILRLDRLKNGRRRAIIIKHRSVEEGKFAEFRIDENGFTNMEKS